MMNASIQTTVVGSYPIPDWLVALPSEAALRDATAVVFHTQEIAGIDLVADGELYRFDVNHPDTNGMIDYFISPMDGIRTRITRDDLRAFRETEGMRYRARPAGIVEGPIGEGALNLPVDCARARSLTRSRMKFTLTGPHMLSKVLMDRHYGDPAELAMALAEVLAGQAADLDADVIQLDEANLPGSPDEGPWAADAINRVIAGTEAETGLHLCFGNYGGQTVQKGTWDRLLDFFNRLNVGHLVLEFAHRGYDELAYFRDLKPEIGIGLGVVDIKSTVVETADQIARRLDHAEKLLGPGRIAYIHPDCGFWMLKRSIADAKMRALVAGRDLFVGA